MKKTSIFILGIMISLPAWSEINEGNWEGDCRAVYTLASTDYDSVGGEEHFALSYEIGSNQDKKFYLASGHLRPLISNERAIQTGHCFSRSGAIVCKLKATFYPSQRSRSVNFFSLASQPGFFLLFDTHNQFFLHNMKNDNKLLIAVPNQRGKIIPLRFSLIGFTKASNKLENQC